jgi:acetyltransferase-like isoleucine patch superfamily enzyme
MDDFSSLAPGVNTGGSCMIGKHTAVCIGATISHNINIGDHCVIGAGSVVLHDVPSFKLAHGAPARIKRNRKKGDRYL